jgi:hypothetical protein
VLICCAVFAGGAVHAEPRCAGSLCSPGEPGHVEAVVELMSALRNESLAQAAAIRASYAHEVQRLAVRDRRELAAAVDTARLVPLPAGVGQNIRVRRRGAHPVGEMDAPYQHLYATARPETIGCLLHVAAGVPSGTLDVTSLARHRAYQQRLARRNANARTDVPTHVMGLAFDVSVLYEPLTVAANLRDTLRSLSANGDLFFVAEQRQLVFHVVPAPARREYYAALYHAVALFPPPLISRPPWPVFAPRKAVQHLSSVRPATDTRGPSASVVVLALATVIAGGVGIRLSQVGPMSRLGLRCVND